MRIAYIAVKGIPIGGGIEKVTEEIGSRLVERGHEVIVYTSRDYGTTDGLYKGMRIKTVPSINTKALHKLSICLMATINVMFREAVDIVHVHAIGPSIFSLIPRLIGIPTVVQTHGIEWKRDKWGVIGKAFLRLAELSVVAFPNRATSVSLVQKSYFKKKFGKEVTYIPNGVSPMKKRGPDWLLTQGIQPNRYILFAARLVEEKGAHFLIQAFRELETDMQLVIAGDAAHADKYKDQLRESAGDDLRIIFTGFVTGEPLAELFSNAYLFCLPSTIEGLPVALLEAMNYDNCCVASDIPENIEALEDYGYTFPSRDVHALRAVLNDLIVHPEKVAEKKWAAGEHVRRNYSWERVTGQMEMLYRTLVRDKDTKLGHGQAKENQLAKC